MNAILDQLKQQPGAKTFDDVAIYQSAAFGVKRTDCKTLIIQEGQKHAQYNDAVRITFLQKGKRKPECYILTSNKFLIVLSAKDAIATPDPFQYEPDGITKSSRFSSFSNEWVEEFEEVLKASGKTPLYELR